MDGVGVGTVVGEWVAVAEPPSPDGSAVGVRASGRVLGLSTGVGVVGVAPATGEIGEHAARESGTNKGIRKWRLEFHRVERTVAMIAPPA